jgi:hypothetical protein
MLSFVDCVVLAVAQSDDQLHACAQRNRQCVRYNRTG